MSNPSDGAIKTMGALAHATLREIAMFEITRAHGEAEFTMDLDLTMADLTEDIWWEFGNLGIRCEGPIAVREWYRRILPVLIGSIEDVEEKSVAFGDSHLVVDHHLKVRFPDGSLRECPSISLYYFRGDKICGERNFCDADMTQLYLKAAGDDLLQVPGISLLKTWQA